MAYLKIKQFNTIRKYKKKFRDEVVKLVYIGKTSAAGETYDPFDGFPMDSFSTGVGDSGYIETSAYRNVKAHVTDFDTRSSYRTLLQTGLWEPGTIQIIADYEDTRLHKSVKTFFDSADYLIWHNQKYEVVVSRPDSFGIDVVTIAKKVS